MTSPTPARSTPSSTDRLLDYVTVKLPAVAEHLDAARNDLLAFTAFPKDVWVQIWSNNPDAALGFVPTCFLKEDRNETQGGFKRQSQASKT